MYLWLKIYAVSATIHNYPPLSCVSKKAKIRTDMGSNCFIPSSHVKYFKQVWRSWRMQKNSLLCLFLLANGHLCTSSTETMLQYFRNSDALHFLISTIQNLARHCHSDSVLQALPDNKSLKETFKCLENNWADLSLKLFLLSQQKTQTRHHLNQRVSLMSGTLLWFSP